MDNEKIKVEIGLEKETINKINSIIGFSSIKSQFSEYELPLEAEHVIKDALFIYFNKIDKLKSLADASGLNDLGKPYKIKNRFKELLKEKNMKQIDLSERTGIDKGNLSMILNNRTQPSLDYFLRIWVTLGCSNIEDVLYRDKPD